MTTRINQPGSFTIDIDPELGQRVKAVATARNLSVDDYVERVVEQSLALERQGEQAQHPAEAIVVPPLTEEEHNESLEAIADLKRLRAELLAKFGKQEPESWVLLNESREERTRQLMRALEE